MASSNSIVYTVLISASIVVSTLFSLILAYSPLNFISLMALYMLACSIYIFVANIINRDKLKDDVHMEVATYISLFNMLFFVCIFVVAVVMRSKIKKAICGY